MALYASCGFGAAAAQAETATGVWISSIIRGLTPLEAAAEIHLVRFAQPDEGIAARIGIALEPGDQLVASQADLDLELTCQGGGILRFSGKFRVAILAPGEDSDCAIDFQQGDLDVLTLAPNQIRIGGFVLTSEDARFWVRLSAPPQVQIYDGKVRFTAPTGEGKLLDSGKLWQMVGGSLEGKPMDSGVLRSSANRYARFDVADGIPGAPTRVARKKVAALEELHVAVLESPRDEAPWIALTKAQQNIADPSKAQVNLERVDLGHGDDHDGTSDAVDDNPAELPTPDRYVVETETVEGLDSGFVVQVFSSPDKPKAEGLLASLQQASFSGFLAPAVVHGRVTYRVLIGPFEERSDAQENRPKILRAATERGYHFNDLPVVIDLARLRDPSPMPPPDDSSKSYYVQLTSMKSRDTATAVSEYARNLLEREDILSRLEQQDIRQPVVFVKPNAGQDRFRVRVGYFEHRSQAEMVKEIFRGGKYRLKPEVFQADPN